MFTVLQLASIISSTMYYTPELEWAYYDNRLVALSAVALFVSNCIYINKNKDKFKDDDSRIGFLLGGTILEFFGYSIAGYAFSWIISLIL